MIIARTIAIALTLLSSPLTPAMAQDICGLSSTALAEEITGRWQLSVVKSTIISAELTQDAPAGDDEEVAIALNETGAGGLFIKEAIVPLNARHITQDGIDRKPDHFAAYQVAKASLGDAESAEALHCPLNDLPQISGQKLTTDLHGDTVNTVELVLMGKGLIAGAQIVDVPAGKLGRKSPDVRIIASIVLRQISKGIDE